MSKRTITPTDGAPWSHHERHGEVHVLFTGRGHTGSRSEIFSDAIRGVSVEPPSPPAWLRQVHAAEVIEGRTGACGEGDALVTAEADLPLSIATADCVPVLLSDGLRVGAAHAGWRGLVAGVLAATAERLDAASTTAWIGPAIGPCCYEVSDEVATEIDASCRGDVVRPGSGRRPHVDLVETAQLQLSQFGVARIQRVEACTRCNAERLWSYRREGPGAGRNLAFIWRSNHRRCDDEGSDGRAAG